MRRLRWSLGIGPPARLLRMDFMAVKVSWNMEEFVVLKLLHTIGNLKKDLKMKWSQIIYIKLIWYKVDDGLMVSVKFVKNTAANISKI